MARPPRLSHLQSINLGNNLPTVQVYNAARARGVDPPTSASCEITPLSPFQICSLHWVGMREGINDRWRLRESNCVELEALRTPQKKNQKTETKSLALKEVEEKHGEP